MICLYGRSMAPKLLKTPSKLALNLEPFDVELGDLSDFV
eukprot:CAMPEP_0184554246 /NCGR_PEP_ID=MMETSP0199_2-20130426/34407_1 /TAXON_ID=1112570 /ORGANISM="Thraustochytrium sp., Strain LLF1b" /LENGTH=38 /DNA_ID= /DNA_START= /DNA_END= /DNA_ORIENTATION=